LIIVYVSFELDGDPVAFDAWFLPLVAATRETPGCVVYDYLEDPTNVRRRHMVEVWDSDASLAAHAGAAPHVEMLALGTVCHGMRDLEIHRWARADGYQYGTRRRTDEHVDGRDHLDELIAAVQARHSLLPPTGAPASTTESRVPT